MTVYVANITHNTVFKQESFKDEFVRDMNLLTSEKFKYVGSSSPLKVVNPLGEYVLLWIN